MQAPRKEIEERARAIKGAKEKYKEKNHEKNLSAQEKTEKQGSRIQKENGFHCRQKGIEEKKKQGQKKAQRIIGRTTASEIFKN